MTFCKAILSLAVLLLATASLALAQGTYTQIDYPGAMETQVLGINSAGDVVGWYGDPSGTHGFLLSGGTYSTIDYPTGGGTILYGINDLGEIVGIGGPNLETQSFTYNIETQSFTSVNYPNSPSTVVTSINNSGTVAGYFFDSALNVSKGFELVGSTYTGINRVGTLNLAILGISSSGTIVGVAQSRRTMLYFYFSATQGVYQKQWITPGASVVGINPAGDSLVGSYPAPGEVAAGFIYENNTLTTLEFPGSNHSDATGINSAGIVGGYFLDASGNEHGFTWTPPADAGKG